MTSARRPSCSWMLFAVVTAVLAAAGLAGPAQAGGPAEAPAPGATPGQPARVDSGPLELHSGQTVRGLRIRNPRGSCVKVPRGVTHVVIQDNEIGPCGSGVQDVGVWIDPAAQDITLRANLIHDVATGIYVEGARHPIVIEGNTAFDIRGPMPRGQFVQFNGVREGTAQSRIVGNVSDQRLATRPTHYEDHISMYDSAGTPGHPILIACNRLRGGDSATGGGIVVGDNGGEWFEVRDNIMVLTPNTAIGVPGAHHVLIRGNRVYNAGATAASLTSAVVSMITFAGHVPTDVTLQDNRGIANGWDWGGDGTLAEGLTGDRTAREVHASNNEWQDRSLTAAIWNAAMPGCR